MAGISFARELPVSKKGLSILLQYSQLTGISTSQLRVIINSPDPVTEAQREIIAGFFLELFDTQNDHPEKLNGGT